MNRQHGRAPFAKASALAIVAVGSFLQISTAEGQTETPPVPTPTPTVTAAPTPAPTPPAGSRGFAVPSAKANVDRNRAMDAAFMASSALAAMQEVELSRIAAEKALNDDVRALARQMVDDRRKAYDELRLLAQNAGLDLPTALDAARRSEVDKLSSLSSPALDPAYVSSLLGKHDEEVDAFRAQARMGQEVELQAWVTARLPVLEEQQATIHEVASGLNLPAR